MVNETIVNETIAQTTNSVAVNGAVESTRLIPFLPDWATFLIALVILFVVYYFLDDESKTSIRNFLKNYGFYILIFLLWLYFRTKWGFIYEFPEKWPADTRRATFFAVFILMLWFLGKWLMYEQRYFTRAFISNGVHGSCNRFQEVGDWIIFFIGTTGSSTEKLVIPFPIPQKLVVVPRIAVDFLGEDIVVKSQVFKLSEMPEPFEVPEDVLHFIENDTFGRLAKNDVYYGLFDEELRARNPGYDEIEAENRRLNTRINELSKMLQGKLKSMKGFISDTFAMQDKIRGKTWKSSQPQQPQQYD